MCPPGRMSLIDVWIKRNATSITGSQMRFSNLSMSGCPYFVDVELLKIIEKTPLYCAMLF